MTSKQTIWLRAETKLYERRVPLVPSHAKELLDKGHFVKVERSPDRIFSDEEYKRAGCSMVDKSSWLRAPKDAYILGIKELPISLEPIMHKHIFLDMPKKGKMKLNNY